MIEKLYFSWRLVGTALAFTVFGIVGVIFPTIAAPLIILSSRKPLVRQRRARKLVHTLFRTYTRLLSAAGLMSWSVEGMHHLNKPNSILLANHPTLLDVVFLVAFIPNADCIIKGKLLLNPSMRGFLKLTGYIPNNYKGAALVNKAAESLANGSTLIIFPEGTRTSPNGNLSFQRGAANILARTDAKATLVTIKCSPLTLTKHHKWYHIPSKRFHLEFRVLDKFNVSHYRELPATIAARHITRDLELLFTKELTAHDGELVNTGN